MTGAGALPIRRHANQVLRLIGSGPCGAIIAANRTNPVSGKLNGEMLFGNFGISVAHALVDDGQQIRAPSKAENSQSQSA